ncbi:hypothetical protein [Salipiger marinus]|uniref:hypothetical protein n=1 Tax=Salipiger marinus TaxID=555512 RepID=UPI004059C049
MTDYIAPAIQIPVSTGSVSRPVRDPLLSGLPAGACRFLFDLDFSWCYPGGALTGRPPASAPTNGQPIYDIAGRADGYYPAPSSPLEPKPSYAGGGFDFSACTRNPIGVKGPSDAWDTIHAADTAHFLVCGYYRMPSQADWKPSGGFQQMFSSAAANGFYISQPDPLIITQISGVLRAVRQRALGSIDQLNLTPSTAHYGAMCQVAYWRNSDGQGFRMKSADAEVSTTAPAGAESTVDYAGIRPTWGDAREAANGPYSTEDAAASNFRSYRGWLEDLTLSARNPLAVLNADWVRVQARIAASAAANGGTATIFV